MLNKTFDDCNVIRKKESGMSYKDLIADGYSKETAKHIALKNKLKIISDEIMTPSEVKKMLFSGGKW